jgi:hypothetical protein
MSPGTNILIASFMVAVGHAIGFRFYGTLGADVGALGLVLLFVFAITLPGHGLGPVPGRGRHARLLIHASELGVSAHEGQALVAAIGRRAHAGELHRRRGQDPSQPSLWIEA